MKLFPYAHATHPQWPMAAALVVAQLRAHMALPDYAQTPTLGLVYITDHYESAAQMVLNYLRAELRGVRNWSGSIGVGIATNNAEYFDEPGLAVMLCDLPSSSLRVFSGLAPLGNFPAHTILVHADPRTPDLGELLVELAGRSSSGYLFGGLASSRGQALQFAVSEATPANPAVSAGRADTAKRPVVPGSVFSAIAGVEPLQPDEASAGVLFGGLSGVAFSQDVQVISRVTQGCLPLRRVAKTLDNAQSDADDRPGATVGKAASYTITEADHNLVLMLDGERALDVLLRDLGVSLDRPQQAIDAVRATLVGLSEAGPRERPTREPAPGAGVSGEPPSGAAAPSEPAPEKAWPTSAVGAGGQFGPETRVRHIVGLDPLRLGVAVADVVHVGQRLAFCQRNVQAARMDLTRICAEIREALEPQTLGAELAGALQSEAQSQPHAARRMAGAIYVSCAGRGGPHFGAESAELQIVRRALGDVPLVGFFAGGEIAHQHVYGYTGVLTVFVMDE
jgi:small ligand-binding sensory domain FIST